MNKRDRTARLLRLQILLWQHTAGIEIEEIARRCQVSKRTAYRDLETLESELHVPIWEDGNKRGITEGYFMPPIAFTQAEAVNIFLAVRKIQYFSPLRNSSLASTFMKLNTIVPPFLKKHIQSTIDHLEKVPKDERKIINFEKLIQAWLSKHRVTFSYIEMYEKKPLERTVEPYFIEPSARNRANYLIGYCRDRESICTFMMDRILDDVKIEMETYEIPDDFDIDQYLNSAWGTFTDRPVETIKLRFSKNVSPAIRETVFHPSQVTEVQRDGSLILTLRVNNTGDFHAWIMSFGSDVEVLEPETLRDQMACVIRSLVDTYNISGKGVKDTHSEGLPSEISDEQWKSIAPVLPPQPSKGRHRADDRAIINGILYVLKSGARWNDIPRKYGAYSTCFSRLQTWKQQGIWTRVWKILSPSG